MSEDIELENVKLRRLVELLKKELAKALDALARRDPSNPPPTLSLIMPSRMLRDWTDSLKLDGISADAERLFVRLIMKADDYGRFHADPRLLKASCFPLFDNLRLNDLLRWLDELSTRNLILRYEADGRSILVIVNYGQRLKSSRAKFPPLPGRDGEWLPVSGGLSDSSSDIPENSGNISDVPGDFRELPGTSGNVRLEEKGREVEGEDEVEEENEYPLYPPDGGLAGNEELKLVIPEPSKPESIMPAGWRKLNRTVRKQTKVRCNSPTMVRIGSWFGRRPETLWTVAEAESLMLLMPSPEEIDGMEHYYIAVIARDEDIRRHSLETLLNNWTSELDRARAFINSQ